MTDRRSPWSGNRWRSRARRAASPRRRPSWDSRPAKFCKNSERHNAVSLDMWESAGRILHQFADDNDVRCVVVTGAGGKAFVSGADISKFGDERATEAAIVRYNVAVEESN